VYEHFTLCQDLLQDVIEQGCAQLPAGLVDDNESSAEAAVRELKEETGGPAINPIYYGTAVLIAI
jgi:8-oxo-dGTP pyrophosphatase MutT (NUDIX family)